MTSKRTTSLHARRTGARFVLAALAALSLATLCGLARPALANLEDGDDNGDMVVFGGQHQVIKAAQVVSGDLVVIGGSADVYGKVDGDAVALGGKIYIAPQGHVNGSLVQVGGTIDNESSTPQGHAAPVPPGQPSTAPIPQATGASAPPEERSSWQGGWFAFFVVDALLAFLAFLLFPARTASAATHLRDNPMLAGILGFFSPIIFVLVVIALSITLVGIPLIPLAVLATIGGYLIGKAAIAEFMGSRIQDLSKTMHPTPVAAVAIGLALLFAITAFTGWLGIVIYFCIVALAIGTSLYMLMRTAEAYRDRRAPSTTQAGVNFPMQNVPGPPSPPVDPSVTHPPQ